MSFLLTSLDFLDPITLSLILGAYRPTINPLLSLLALLWACCGPFSFFYILPMGLFFLSFWAHSSPFAPLYEPVSRSFLPLGLNGFFLLANFGLLVLLGFFSYWACQNKSQHHYIRSKLCNNYIIYLIIKILQLRPNIAQFS